MTDLLTGLMSRHQLHILLPELAAKAKPFRPLTLLLLKVKDFQLWQGHLTPLAADHLLKITAELLTEHTPRDAFLARWNNTVFALLLPNTPGWQAESLAEELSDVARGIKMPAFFDYQSLSIDFSYGIASCPPTECNRLPCSAEEQLRQSSGGVFAELMLSAPPLPDALTLNAYIHLASRYAAAGDPYLRRHGQMTASYSQELARRLKLSEAEQEDLRVACALADISMSEAAGAALGKPGPLTLAEYKRIQKHPLLSAQLCESFSLPQHISNIILCHHEYVDGSGYPNGLRGEDIPYAASILGISGAFAAMLLPRPYRPAKKLFAAKAALKSNLWPEEIIRELCAIV